MLNGDDGNYLVKGLNFVGYEQYAKKNSARNHDTKCSIKLCKKNSCS